MKIKFDLTKGFRWSVIGKCI